MAAAETARLIASLELKDKLSAGVKNAQQTLGGFSKAVGKSHAVSTAFGVGLERVATAGIRKLAEGVFGGIESLANLESAVMAVDGAIAQVAPTWTKTGSQIAEAANRIEANVGAAFDDKDIVRATQTLIRYGKVTESNLEPAMQVMTDLAARTGSVDSASQLLAKALADPAKAAGKLARSGVVLTKAQQDQIEAMVEVNDIAGAQAFLLRELEKTTKGAAAASQGPYKRSQMVLADTMEDAQRALAEGFLPVIEKVRDLLQKGLADPNTIRNIREFGRGLASGLDSVIEIARGLPWDTIGDSLRLAGTGAKAVLSAFTSLPPWVQTAVLTGWGLNKLSGGILGDVASGLIKGVLGMTAGVVNIKAGMVNGAGGVVPPTGAGGKALAGLTGLLKVAVVGAVVVEGFALWAQSVGKFVEENQAFKDQGLNAAEVAAIRYYNASAADQATMAKRMGNIPTIADWQSAIAKLNKDKPRSSQDNDPDKRQWRNDNPERVKEIAALRAENREKLAAIALEVQRKGEQTTASVDKTKSAVDASKARLAAAAALGTAATRTAGSITASATRGVAPPIVSAIYAARPIITTNVHISGASVTAVQTSTERNGGGGASRNRDRMV